MIQTLKQKTETNPRSRFNLPGSFEPYIDKYFLRTLEVLKAEKINPWVLAQVMIRKGPGKVYGVDESLAILNKYSNLVKNNGRVYALKEGSPYNPKDTTMLIQARIQDIVALETMYLGVIAAETTKANDNHGVDIASVKENMRKVVEAAGGRQVSYFGARHWRYDEDATITRAAYEGGATSASTDIGAATFNQAGMGTTPHVLENIMAYFYGKERAVVETLKAFDRTIDKKVPRIILVDYRNREIDDSLACAREVPSLYGIRIDTCGENLGQGALEAETQEELLKLFGKVPEIPEPDKKYWFGKGVTVTGAYAARKVLDEQGYKNVKIWLSSGFADAEKVRAFVRAEKQVGRLFDGLGVGQVYKSRATKMDIVAVGKTPETLVPISKTGRGYNPNPKLELRLGGAR